MTNKGYYLDYPPKVRQIPILTLDYLKYPAFVRHLTFLMPVFVFWRRMAKNPAFVAHSTS